MATKKVSKKKTSKKAPAKKAAKKAPAKKTAAKKAPVKKTAAKKASSKKVDKKAPAKKTATKKTSAKKPVRPAAVLRPPTDVAAASNAKSGGKKLSAKQIAGFKENLLTLRERISGEYSMLSRDNLEANQRDASLSDQGTDTFDREMELNMMGSEQEVLFEIDAALRRIEKGTYGVCELTGDPINLERLNAIPYVRYTVRAQSELEKGRARYRPFGNTMRG